MAKRRGRTAQSRLKASARYSSKIIKGGALLADTKTLLANWDLAASDSDNLERMRRENHLGKVSRSRVEDVLTAFRQRFLTDSTLMRALVLLVRGKLSATSLDRILYFHAAQADNLLHDVVVDVLLPLQMKGITDIDVLDLQKPLRKWRNEGKTTGEWSDATIMRIAQGLLSTLRDFGVLRGAVNKQIAPAYLPVDAFAYLMFFLKLRHPSGARLVALPDWKLFFLSVEGVERFLFEAHQRELLEYHAAGSVTRLTFPVGTLEEYANVLAKRAH